MDTGGIARFISRSATSKTIQAEVQRYRSTCNKPSVRAARYARRQFAAGLFTAWPWYLLKQGKWQVPYMEMRRTKFAPGKREPFGGEVVCPPDS